MVGVDVVTKLLMAGVFHKLMYADDLVLTKETVDELRNDFRKWK